MATQHEVEAALHRLAARLSEVDPATREKHVVARSLSCEVPDLGIVYSARIDESGLSAVTTEPLPGAQVRLRVDSDDLIALAEGRLKFPAAWATGRLRVEASVLDLLKLRTLL